jgi:hypothetical protein
VRPSRAASDAWCKTLGVEAGADPLPQLPAPAAAPEGPEEDAADDEPDTDAAWADARDPVSVRRLLVALWLAREAALRAVDELSRHRHRWLDEDCDSCGLCWHETDAQCTEMMLSYPVGSFESNVCCSDRLKPAYRKLVALLEEQVPDAAGPAGEEGDDVELPVPGGQEGEEEGAGDEPVPGRKTLGGEHGNPFYRQ